MSVNDLTFNQLSTVLNSIVSQATGQTSIAITDTSSFVSVAQLGLKAGYDPLTTAISQVLSRTIFSVRPYKRKLGNLEVSNQKYGNIVRKINMLDSAFEDDERMTLTDGQSVDMYKVKKPQVQQTNFYGENIYQKHVTIYKDQLDCAFSSPDEFASFISLVMSNANDMIEQAHETTARMTLVNLIGGVIGIANAPQIVHVLTEYKAASGNTALTAANIFSADNIEKFTKWFYARVATVSDFLTERTKLYHQTLSGKTIMRHSPKSKQRLYTYSPLLNQIETSVLSSVFHDERLKLEVSERLNFWQSMDGTTLGSSNINTMEVLVTPSYTDSSTGEVVRGMPVSKPIIGVLMDSETAGYTVVNQWAQATPFNAAGGYFNQYWHFTDRYWNDFTENCVVFVLD